MTLSCSVGISRTTKKFQVSCLSSITEFNFESRRSWRLHEKSFEEDTDRSDNIIENFTGELIVYIDEAT